MAGVVATQTFAYSNDISFDAGDNNYKLKNDSSLGTFTLETFSPTLTVGAPVRINGVDYIYKGFFQPEIDNQGGQTATVPFFQEVSQPDNFIGLQSVRKLDGDTTDNLTPSTGTFTPVTSFAETDIFGYFSESNLDAGTVEIKDGKNDGGPFDIDGGYTVQAGVDPLVVGSKVLINNIQFTYIGNVPVPVNDTSGFFQPQQFVSSPAFTQDGENNANKPFVLFDFEKVETAGNIDEQTLLIANFDLAPDAFVSTQTFGYANEGKIDGGGLVDLGNDGKTNVGIFGTDGPYTLQSTSATLTAGQVVYINNVAFTYIGTVQPQIKDGGGATTTIPTFRQLSDPTVILGLQDVEKLESGDNQTLNTGTFSPINNSSLLGEQVFPYLIALKDEGGGDYELDAGKTSDGGFESPFTIKATDGTLTLNEQVLINGQAYTYLGQLTATVEETGATFQVPAFRRVGEPGKIYALSNIEGVDKLVEPISTTAFTIGDPASASMGSYAFYNEVKDNEDGTYDIDKDGKQSANVNAPAGAFPYKIDGFTAATAVGEKVLINEREFIYLGTIEVAAAEGGGTFDMPIFQEVGDSTTILGFQNVLKLDDSDANIKDRTLDLDDYTPCFMAGAMVATPNGPVAIEDLKVGDLVSTPEGPRAVKFVGRTTRHIHTLMALGRMPVTIEAGAFGNNLPSAPLRCTPSHAFALSGLLIETQAMINGTTISQSSHWPEALVTYYSLELDSHSLVWVNDALTETYYPNVRGAGFTRELWNNYEDYLSLYVNEQPLAELEMVRVPFSRQLPADVRAALGIPSTETPSLSLVD